MPDLLADEMASDLEADLADAQADGVSSAEILGESDPRRFAATWARERGLVTEPPPQRSRKRLWIGLAVALVLLLLFIALPTLAFIGGGPTGVHSSSPVLVTPPGQVYIPVLVGRRENSAVAIARRRGLRVHVVHVERHGATVMGQRPGSGRLVKRGSVLRLRIGRG